MEFFVLRGQQRELNVDKAYKKNINSVSCVGGRSTLTSLRREQKCAKTSWRPPTSVKILFFLLRSFVPIVDNSCHLQVHTVMTKKDYS